MSVIIFKVGHFTLSMLLESGSNISVLPVGAKLN